MGTRGKGGGFFLGGEGEEGEHTMRNGSRVHGGMARVAETKTKGRRFFWGGTRRDVA